jgi:hypothetical protein
MGLSSAMKVLRIQELKPNNALSLMHMKDVKSSNKLFECNICMVKISNLPLCLYEVVITKISGLFIFLLMIHLSVFYMTFNGMVVRE